jgi:spermidine/putrescine transport system ATP-binding protein
MQLELKHLNRRLGITFMYVTHDQEEALTMSDRIALMRNGRIEQLSTPREMYEQPASRYVADFIGETNLLRGVVTRTGAGKVELRLSAGLVEAVAGRDWKAGDEAWLAVRPEHVKPVTTPGVANRIAVTVSDVVFTGVVTRVYTALDDGGTLVLHWPPEERAPEAGRRLEVTWPVERGSCVGD